MIQLLIHKERYLKPAGLVTFIKDNQPIYKDSDVYNYFVNNKEKIIDDYLSYILEDYCPCIDYVDIDYGKAEKELYNYLFN